MTPVLAELLGRANGFNGGKGELVGVAVATVAGDRAWVMRISLAAAWRHRGSAARCSASWSGGWSRSARDRYLTTIPHGDLDMAAIVEESRLFTPADIEFAARRTAQLAFERVVFEGGGQEDTKHEARSTSPPFGVPTGSSALSSGGTQIRAFCAPQPGARVMHASSPALARGLGREGYDRISTW